MNSDHDPDRKISLNLRDIPADLRNKFKSACSANEQTMREAVMDFMRSVVEGRREVQRTAG